MHAKHQNGPGNGYRSNAMGGMAAASRVPPEGAVSHRMYNSEYRNYNRGGYGVGGHAKQFQSPLPPPRVTDILVEAGRLAAEYLVSKGVLPSTALSGKWQNDGLKNQLGNFQGFVPHGEKIQSPVDGRVSAHSRLGNTALGVGPGRRRYSDEYNNSMGSRSSIRGRRRTGSFKYYGSEVNRELGRSGSWSEKIRTSSPGMEADSDAFVGHHDEQPAGKDDNGEIQSLFPGEITQELQESGLEKCNLVEDVEANDSREKYLPSAADAEPIKNSDGTNKFNDEAEVVKEGRNDNDLRQNHDENKVRASLREDNLVREDHADLVKHCKFVNVPTKARSSLTIKGSKSDREPMSEDVKISKREHLENFEVHVDVDISAGNASSHQNREFKSLQSDVPAVEKSLDITYTTRPGQCLRPGAFPERSVNKEQQPDEMLLGYGSSNTMLMERGEKRPIDFNTDDKEDFKRFRQWVPQLDAQSHSSQPLYSSMENQSMVQEPSTSHAQLNLPPDQKSLDESPSPKNLADSSEFMEEKQLFPGSFKTCDLNLVGTCDVNENHDGDPMLVFPSVRKIATLIDVDLSISNNVNLPNKNGVDDGIEVIDLEKDSAQEDKTFSNPERRDDTVFTDLDGFPNNVHNANGIPNAQDGYGFMISDLLGNDSPSVPTGLNSLHNHMGLPTAEGILGEDDSIYMSLGEIPISLLGAWEQPTQDYGKPF